MRLVVCSLLLAACGDNNRAVPDGGPADAPPDGPPPAPHAVVVAGDFTPGHPGILSVLDLGTQQVVQNAAPAGAIGDDPILRKVGDELFVVNRSDGDNVTILKASDFSLVDQIGTGQNSNPQDVAVKGDKLYVPVFGGSGVAVLTRGSTTIGSIDLSIDDPDGKPNCVSAALVGDDLYVACGNLDGGFKPRTLGKVYVVDTTTDTVQASRTVTLTHKNPLGVLERVPTGGPMAGDLVIPTVEDFVAFNGCVERVTPGAQPSAAGCLPTNPEMNGYVNRADFQHLQDGDTIMWLAVQVTDFTHATLRGFDLQTQLLWPDPISADGEAIADTVVCPDTSVVVVDSTASANGLRIYQNAVEVTTAPLPIGLSSFSAHGLACY
jgi:hypothetical protein